MDTDNQLLQSYAKNGSERAFRELVERRINLVHSAALRESGGDAQFAEDITQAVFTELARNANALIRLNPGMRSPTTSSSALGR